MCQPRKHLARIFFPADCTCVKFFLDNSLVQEIFSYPYALAGYFFFKITQPPPSQKVNGWPLNILNSGKNFCRLLCVIFAYCVSQNIKKMTVNNKKQKQTNKQKKTETTKYKQTHVPPYDRHGLMTFTCETDDHLQLHIRLS